MHDAFDPYRKWLGIHAAEQPANHYRLLGITPFEDDPDVIESAADQRMAHVRAFQTGAHSALSQRILNELAAAKLCLLNPSSRQAYDNELRRRMSPVPVTTPVVRLPARPVILVNAPAAQAPSLEFAAGSSPRTGRTDGRRVSPAAWLVLAAVIPAAIFVGYLMSGKRGNAVAVAIPKEPQHAEQSPPSMPEEPAPVQEDSPKRESPPVRVKEPDLPTPSPVADGEAIVEAQGGNSGETKRFAYAIPDPSRARWSLEGDELVQSSLDADVSILFGDPGWEDFDYAVEAKRTEGDDGAACFFRYQTQGDTELYVPGHRAKTHEAFSADDGHVTQLASREGALPIGAWHRLEVGVRGKTARCFLNGEEILSFETARAGRGKVGLRTWGAKYRFRNIVVKAPDGRVLLEGLPDLDAEPPAESYAIDDIQMLAERGGILPAAGDGRPLNFDFEQGDLRDWSAVGDAFSEQPVKGDTLHARYKYLNSRHAGEFWIGSGEKGNAATGTLTSAPFKVTHPYASFLMAGGGPWTGTCVELLRRGDDRPIFRAVGHSSDTLEPVAVDLTEHLGQEIVIRVADRDDGEWGRIGFDDFRFHDARPNLQPAYLRANTASSGNAVDVLKLVDIRRDARGGVWQWDGQKRLAASGGNARMLRLPVDAPEEYNLAVTLEGAPSVEDVHLLLPVAGRQIEVVIDGWDKTVSGIDLIDGKRANDNESTHRGAVLRDGEPNRLVCRVRRNAVTLACNGETVIDWRGDPKRLSLEFGKVAGWEGLVIGGIQERFRVSQIELAPPEPQAEVVAKVRIQPTKRQPKTAKPAKPIDLVKQINVRDATAQGEWRINSGRLVFPQTGAASIPICSSPPDEYKLTAIVKCPQHDGMVGFGIVVGDSQAMLMIDAVDKQWSGLGLVGGVGVSENGTGARGTFLLDGRPNPVECIVTRKGAEYRVRLSCNRRQLVDWTGDPHLLSLHSNFAGRHGARQLFICSGNPSPFEVTNLTLQTLVKGLPEVGEAKAPDGGNSR